MCCAQFSCRWLHIILLTHTQWFICSGNDLNVIPDSCENNSNTNLTLNSTCSDPHKAQPNKKDCLPQCPAMNSNRPSVPDNYTLDDLLFGESLCTGKTVSIPPVTTAAIAVPSVPQAKTIATHSRYLDSGIGTHESKGISLSCVDDSSLNSSVSPSGRRLASEDIITVIRQPETGKWCCYCVLCLLYM